MRSRKRDAGCLFWEARKDAQTGRCVTQAFMAVWRPEQELVRTLTRVQIAEDPVAALLDPRSPSSVFAQRTDGAKKLV